MEPDGYTRFVRSMPRPKPPECAVRGCDQLKLKFSPLFCSAHELSWIAMGNPPSMHLDSQAIGAAILWAKDYRIQT